MSLEAVGKFIGPFEIESINEIGGEEDVVTVVFTTGRTRMFHKKTLEIIMTAESSDLSLVQSKKFEAIIPLVMSILTEYDLETMEIQMLFKTLGQKFDEKFNHARSILWFGGDKEYVEGFDSENYISLGMADQVIKNEQQSTK